MPAATENLSKLQDGLSLCTAHAGEIEKAHNEEVAHLRAENIRLKKIAGMISRAEGIESLEKAAEKEGMELVDWASKTLVEAATDQGTDIAIDRDVYRRLERIAHGRSQKLSLITKGEQMTNVLKRALDNEHL